jgi:hypothetical protein
MNKLLLALVVAAFSPVAFSCNNLVNVNTKDRPAWMAWRLAL